MKTVLIVGNGDDNSASFYRELAKNVDFIIGVDGGAGKLYAHNIKFNLAIGDFDSISQKALSSIKKAGIRILRFPKDKDYSDTELAIQFALKNHFDKFILSGMCGKRIDHTLFNISLMCILLKKRKDVHIIEENEEIYITQDKISIETEKGNTVSLYPITSRVQNVMTSGLKYKLRGRTLLKGRTLTLSNIATSNIVRIEISKGVLLIIIYKKQDSQI